MNGTDHQYGFGGKEEQNELGLGWIDITARNYDPALGRWMNIDPLAEDMRRHSPYNYAFNSPISFMDYDGMAPDWINNGDGTWTAEAGDSASTLSRDAGISFEKAKEVMANTPKSNSSLGNMGTYVDTDGVEKSAVDEGDTVAIPEQVNSIVQETNAKQEEINQMEDAISKNTSLVETIDNKIDSLDKIVKRGEVIEQSINDMKNDVSDPGVGQNLGKGLLGYYLNTPRTAQKKQIKKAENVKDSLLKVNGAIQQTVNKKRQNN